MDEPSKVYVTGNSKVTVFSPLLSLTEEERKQWFLDEWEKGNPILKEIAAAVHDCYRD